MAQIWSDLYLAKLTLVNGSNMAESINKVEQMTFADIGGAGEWKKPKQEKEQKTKVLVLKSFYHRG